jgi:hypothetical protein
MPNRVQKHVALENKSETQNQGKTSCFRDEHRKDLQKSECSVEKEPDHFEESP